MAVGIPIDVDKCFKEVVSPGGSKWRYPFSYI